MKKIIFLVTQSEFGGAQRYILEIASNLDKQKYNILVAAGEGDEGLFQKLKHTQVQTIRLKHMKRTPLPWQVISSVSEIINLLKTEKPDILFLCSTTAGLIGSIASYLYGFQVSPASPSEAGRAGFKFQVIYRIGGWSFRDPRAFWQNKILLWLEKLTAPFKDKIIVNSEIDREVAIKDKICAAEKIVKIYNGIDLNKLNFLSKIETRQELSKSLPETYNLKPETYLIGAVANLYKTKGLEYLIKSAHILNTKHIIQNTKYIIIGEGKQRKKLESLIKKYNLENQVFLLGRIPDAHQYLKAFDVFVLPSLKEGFPWIILEAMAAGLPIISTNVGALPEIIEDGKEGILIKPKNPEIMAEKTLKLIENPKLAQGLRNQAIEKLKEFSLSKMVQETERLF